MRNHFTSLSTHNQRGINSWLYLYNFIFIHKSIALSFEPQTTMGKAAYDHRYSLHASITYYSKMRSLKILPVFAKSLAD